MSFFRRMYLAIQEIFGLSVTKRYEFRESSDPLDIPAFVPPAPQPIGKLETLHFKPKRQNDALLGCTCTRVGGIILVECATRFDYREVVRAISRACGAQGRGIGHLLQVRMRSILIREEAMTVVEKAARGASYHELRALAV